VLVNDAGIGVIGVFEVTPMATVRDVFETNTFGVMAMTQAMLPQFRARRSGVVVNVTAVPPAIAVIEGVTGNAFEILGGQRKSARQSVDFPLEVHEKAL
jgi:NAD(P)-dependent dehydrogenase (short-subunit alcohol dehydrogenase family)